MSSQDPESKYQLALTISSLHESGAYSDLKIVCGLETYNVHKAIICPQSEFFRAACRSDAFQEGKTGVITLPCNPGRDWSALKAPIKPDEFDWDLDVEDSSAIKLMIHYFYHHDYPSELPTHPGHKETTPENLAKGVLVVHSKMYAMGDKYQVPGLKALAARKFGPCWTKTCAGLNTAIVIAFVSTPDTDQTLRKILTDTCGRNISIPRDPAVDQTIKEIPELLYAVYRKFLDRS